MGTVHPLLKAHAIVAVFVHGCWITMLHRGGQMMHGRALVRRTHRMVAMAFVLRRLLNRGTSLMAPTLEPDVAAALPRWTRGARRMGWRPAADSRVMATALARPAEQLHTMVGKCQC